MLLAMAGFAVEDSLIKVLSVQFPISQILLILGLGGMVIFLGIALVQGHRLITPNLLSMPFLVRFFSDMFAALFFISAIALIPLSIASTILQAVPIIVTMGAALFLGQIVGWRRWSAIIAGFLAVLGVIFLATRDLATRVMAPDLSTITVSAYAFLAMALGGVIALPFFPSMQYPDAVAWSIFFCAIILGGLAYVAVVIATRTGDIGAIAPFRYSRLVFAIIIAVTFLGERPDMPTMIGAAIIVASGVYAFWRERLRSTMENLA